MHNGQKPRDLNILESNILENAGVDQDRHHTENMELLMHAKALRFRNAKGMSLDASAQEISTATLFTV